MIMYVSVSFSVSVPVSVLCALARTQDLACFCVALGIFFGCKIVLVIYPLWRLLSCCHIGCPFTEESARHSPGCFA